MKKESDGLAQVIDDWATTYAIDNDVVIIRKKRIELLSAIRTYIAGCLPKEMEDKSFYSKDGSIDGYNQCLREVKSSLGVDV